MNENKETDAQRLGRQLVEQYARRQPAAAQGSLFQEIGPGSGDAQWDERKHPRDNDGKFREKAGAKDPPAWLKKGDVPKPTEALANQKQLFPDSSEKRDMADWLSARTSPKGFFQDEDGNERGGDWFNRELSASSNDELTEALAHIRAKGDGSQSRWHGGAIKGEMRARGMEPDKHTPPAETISHEITPPAAGTASGPYGHYTEPNLTHAHVVELGKKANELNAQYVALSAAAKRAPAGKALKAKRDAAYEAQDDARTGKAFLDAVRRHYEEADGKKENAAPVRQLLSERQRILDEAWQEVNSTGHDDFATRTARSEYADRLKSIDNDLRHRGHAGDLPALDRDIEARVMQRDLRRTAEQKRGTEYDPATGEFSAPKPVEGAKALPEHATAPPEGEQTDKPVPDSVFDTPAGRQPNDQDSPREAAAEATKRQIDSDYAFARQSKVANAGEDLLGSARHRANAWKGLDQAEKDGNAAEFVTRDMLLKSEPHGLMNHVAQNPLTALAMHYALRNFPAQPQYGHRKLEGETARKAREQYLDVYRRFKEKAEQLAKEVSEPMEAASQLHKFTEGERGRLYAEDRQNTIGNALYATSKHLGQRYRGIGKQINDFKTALTRNYGPTAESTAADKIAGHASDIIEGASLNKSFGIASEKRSTKPTFNPAEVYVKKAERKGGPDIAVKSAGEGKKFLIDKLKMRGLQFGNYVTDEEREHHLTKVSEAFADLADVLGLPEHLVSWKGKLGVAFGARGHGTASAHYEPSTTVVNLTRASGVGALAHEWGHFLDHALAGFKPTGERSGYYSERHPAGDDPMEKAYASLHQSMEESGFNRRLSGVLSKYVREKSMGEKKREYWRSTREKFARSFERYVERKLSAAGRKNTYLAGLSNAHELWPSDEEVDAMTPAFDAIFGELRANKEKYARRFAALLAGQLAEHYSRHDRYRLKELYRRAIARQLFQHYSRSGAGHDVSTEARAADGTWTAGGAVPHIGKWLKERTATDASQFRRDLESLPEEDLHAAIEHIRTKGTAAQQHRQTAAVKAEMKARGITAEDPPTGSDVALQAIYEGRSVDSVRKATGLKAGPEARKLAKDTAAIYERLTKPWMRKAKQHIKRIEDAGRDDGETTAGRETRHARKALGIQHHEDFMRRAKAAIRKGDEDFLRKFNRAMEGDPVQPVKGTS